jgi:predicted nucleic acid-binding Zn ribbon protein
MKPILTVAQEDKLRNWVAKCKAKDVSFFGIRFGRKSCWFFGLMVLDAPNQVRCPYCDAELSRMVTHSGDVFGYLCTSCNERFDVDQVVNRKLITEHA